MADENRHHDEITLKGIPASPGIAIGPAYVFHKDGPVVQERSIKDVEVDQELKKLTGALDHAKKELSKIVEFAEKQLGSKQARIFEAQLMMLDDSVLFESIRKRVRKELKNVEYIVREEIGKYHAVMHASKDEYTRERANDVEDVQNRILRNLQDQKLVSKIDGSHIIVSKNLAAADALILSRNDVLGYVTEIGGATSHMVLLARALNIPTIVGLHDVSTMLHKDDVVVLDGYSGTLVMNPSRETRKKFEEKREEHREFEGHLAALRDLPAETLDGRRVQLSANVELQEELGFVKRQGADGIGLYRSETLLLGKEVFPTEEEQYKHYKTIAESAFPNRVIIRTFDIGGDKLMAQAVKESNPFLGWRGIRVMLDMPNIFLQQLRAILRASAKKNVSIMFPMVSHLKEVRKAKELIEVAKSQLAQKKMPFDPDLQIGVMIEVPAAAVIAEDLAREVNFLSIGTNDLIQYLLAVDRGNEIVSDLFQEFHPAVIRFLRRIIERGKGENVWVGMCGEMAGDPLATMLLLGLGLDEFSVVPHVLPEIKKIIRSVHYSEAKHLAQKVLTMETEEEIEDYLKKIMKLKFPDIPIE
jgi:phosphoenolpyruvate-protein phosphotransferase (PTS system enzyme I)